MYISSFGHPTFFASLLLLFSSAKGFITSPHFDLSSRTRDDHLLLLHQTEGTSADTSGGSRTWDGEHPRQSWGGDLSFPLLSRTTGPPPLSVPVFSLATINPSTKKTNMNIVTYACPVGTTTSSAAGEEGSGAGAGEKRWVLSLYRGTLSHRNFMESGWGVLQVLTKKQTPVVNLLGKQTGSKVDKRELSKVMGFEWTPFKGLRAPYDQVELMRGCAAYLTVKKIDRLDAGDHDVVFCHMDGSFGCEFMEGPSDPVLYTNQLRKLNIL
uniref:Flavin reductase like domain-containing protein n=1 Tax=Fibrocapsa japonica TaxID=94617 RepID=A0A7S2V2S1_9STRA|mmetsp:Transcript_4770/g.7129  ORF Transcript_4770/g.7129 Transcript_4770/m.7129 type:complete len:268 (+) Transcript_4770:60-863(+)